MGVTFILSAGADVCEASHLCMGGIGFSPLGETGEGFEFCPPLFVGHLPQIRQ